MLDPSMKSDFIKFYFYTIDESVDLKMRELKLYLRKYYLEYKKIVRSQSFPVFILFNEQSTSESSEPTTSSLGTVYGKRRVESAFALFASQNSDSHSERSELDTYLEDPRVPLRTYEDFNVLACAAGRILGKNRTSLSPETLEALICVKDWLIRFNDEEEGDPMTGQRMFGSEDEEDDE
ncbi:hypothetical protein BAE44_0004535 [Dichanthelium oligosanthes]|uniref:HAT C-terminal dimerisation domain-containing protein n=1 Tax=Dichanthelium oligosanthes TaxID=888268 RepID=A0A1E5WAJ4_9POAL|nr:hypothetical protein BAE44_0004535 [Dichanthelium oligosanthes]